MDTSTLANAFLESVRFRFEAIKKLGDGALVQTQDHDLWWSPDAESNSVAVTVKHLHGNTLSRWTDFLTTDGDKNRNRDAEFEANAALDRAELLRRWEEGWEALFGALAALRPEDLTREVTIRGQKLGVVDAIHRQLAHYSYHVGQMVFVAKHRAGDKWQTLSIARGQSGHYKPTTRD
jgi:hypothetical protein